MIDKIKRFVRRKYKNLYIKYLGRQVEKYRKMRRKVNRHILNYNIKFDANVSTLDVPRFIK